MDARITKPRLANLLSYDWLKILCGIIAAVLVLLVVFTTIKPRPRDNQDFTVYGYQELIMGDEANGLAEEMLGRGVFSYDIAKTHVENFGTGRYSGMAFTARRAAGQGTVMFTTTNPADEEEEDGQTVLEALVGTSEIALDVERYLIDCENYLIRFFGNNWRENALDEAEALACFTERNGKDNRFRSEARRQEGILAEQARLEKLRQDFDYVLARFEDGTFGYAYSADEQGEPRAVGIALGRLAGLGKLFYYKKTSETFTGRATENICLILFRNDRDAGVPADMVKNDLRYEPVSFLRYLCERYGA